MRELAEKTNKQTRKLERELNRSLETLGRQLTARSGKFATDYTPITEKLH
jgi:hypothetical protein